MGKKFFGKLITIKKMTAQVDSLIQSWGYQLETSEALTVLWPPALLVNSISNVLSDNVFLYSSFDLQAHGNINVNTEDIHRITDRISRITIKPKTKMFINKKNAEIIIDKCVHKSNAFEEIPSTESFTNTYTVQDDRGYFLFCCSGTKSLSKGQSVLLTSHCEVKGYYFSYLINHIYPVQQNKITGESLLIDILAHYKREEAYNGNIFNSRSLSKVASQYIEKCESIGLINSLARQYIEEDRL